MARFGRRLSWGFADFGPRPNAAARRTSGARAAAVLEKKGRKLSPVRLEGLRRGIARTFWGQAWCDNLEHSSDFANRLPRGRAYVRTGAVIDLQIAPGRVTALVQGSSLYEVVVAIEAVPPARWKTLVRECAGGIDSLIELLQGKLSSAVMAAMTRPETGLLPAPGRIEMKCSCPDWATMCKHVAAVLYGIGARLDEAPELLFRLRGTDPTDLVATAARAGIGGKREAEKSKGLGAADLGSVFGIDIDTAEIDAPPKRKPTVARREVRETVARAELLRLGLTPGTLRSWLASGVLLTTPSRGVYATTAESKRRLAAHRAPASPRGRRSR